MAHFGNILPFFQVSQYVSNIFSYLLLKAFEVVRAPPFHEVESHRRQEEDQGHEEPGEDFQLAPYVGKEGQIIDVAAAGVLSC